MEINIQTVSLHFEWALFSRNSINLFWPGKFECMQAIPLGSKSKQSLNILFIYWMETYRLLCKASGRISVWACSVACQSTDIMFISELSLIITNVAAWVQNCWTIYIFSLHTLHIRSKIRSSNAKNLNHNKMQPNKFGSKYFWVLHTLEIIQCFEFAWRTLLCTCILQNKSIYRQHNVKWESKLFYLYVCKNTHLFQIIYTCVCEAECTYVESLTQIIHVNAFYLQTFSMWHMEIFAYMCVFRDVRCIYAPRSKRSPKFMCVHHL